MTIDLKNYSIEKEKICFTYQSLNSRKNSRSSGFVESHVHWCMEDFHQKLIWTSQLIYPSLIVRYDLLKLFAHSKVFLFNQEFSVSFHNWLGVSLVSVFSFDFYNFCLFLRVICLDSWRNFVNWLKKYSTQPFIPLKPTLFLAVCWSVHNPEEPQVIHG